MTESEAKKIIKLLERISNQLSTISEDVAYVVSREKARISGRMRRSRNCSNSHASAFRPVKNDDENTNYPAARTVWGEPVTGGKHRHR